MLGPQFSPINQISGSRTRDHNFFNAPDDSNPGLSPTLPYDGQPGQGAYGCGHMVGSYKCRSSDYFPVTQQIGKFCNGRDDKTHLLINNREWVQGDYS